MLNNFQWFRKFKGGIWWQFLPANFPYADFHWKNTQPEEHERINQIEDYTRRDKACLDLECFTTAIKNIPVNGEWKHEVTLATYIAIGLSLRKIRIEDKYILDILHTLFKASAMESQSDLHANSYSDAEIKQILSYLDKRSRLF